MSGEWDVLASELADTREAGRLRFRRTARYREQVRQQARRDRERAARVAARRVNADRS